MKMRFQKVNRDNKANSNLISQETVDNLLWIEENISTTLVDK